MTAKNKTLLALEDAVRALRDIAELDDTRPAKNAPEKVAERALERITVITGTDVHLPGHTARPDEDMFPMIAPAVVPNTLFTVGGNVAASNVRREISPFPA